MQGFRNFSEAADLRHYHPVPGDWSVVLTDVKGSTKAIEAGRYREVNMAGAACITAAVNSCKDIVLPYVFGGDGATILVPPSHIEEVKRSLLSLRQSTELNYGLSLRVGIVPASELTARGKSVLIAKYILPTGCTLAMFSGGGVSMADKMIKEEGFALEDAPADGDTDLTGLSCRWQPIASQKGTILTLLVMETASAADGKVYNEIIDYIHSELMDEYDGNPSSSPNMRYSWPDIQTLRRSKLVWGKRDPVLSLLMLSFKIVLFNLVNRFRFNTPVFNVTRYRKETIINSDYKKFDDMLRMVIDCSKPAAEKIETYLLDLHSKGKIVYGTHYSGSALMTCFVTSMASDGHVHFIDGDDGGYALAAKQLKEQLSRKMQ